MRNKDCVRTVSVVVVQACFCFFCCPKNICLDYFISRFVTEIVHKVFYSLKKFPSRCDSEMWELIDLCILLTFFKSLQNVLFK